MLVRHDHRTGTTLLQPEELPRDQALRLFTELDAERAEIFLSRAVMLVEGRTEKLAFPFVFRALGYDADQEAIAIVDCAGKGNIPLFAEVCNACQIPYVVVHDRDAPRGQQPTDAERISNEAIVRAAGRRRTIALVPDFEGVAGARAARQAAAAPSARNAVLERARRRSNASIGAPDAAVDDAARASVVARERRGRSSQPIGQSVACRGRSGATARRGSP